MMSWTCKSLLSLLFLAIGFRGGNAEAEETRALEWSLRDLRDAMMHTARNKTSDYEVSITITMQNASSGAANGCGFKIAVTDEKGKHNILSLPRKTFFNCPGDILVGDLGTSLSRAKIATPGATYEGTVKAKTLSAIEVVVEGGQFTFLQSICFGFRSDKQRRAICLDANVLRGCQAINGAFNMANLNYEDILFSRTKFGIHKVVISDPHTVFLNALKILTSHNTETTASQRLCERINVKRGRLDRSEGGCPGAKQICTFGQCTIKTSKNMPVDGCVESTQFYH